MDYGFKITARAPRDLRSICATGLQDEVSDLPPYGHKLLAFAKSLRKFPYRHGSFQRDRQLRKVVLDLYLIFYKINEETRTVEILRFWHAARDPSKLRLKEGILTYAEARLSLDLVMRVNRSPVVLALTWDGARWPKRLLPPEARAFLAGKMLGATTLAQLFACDMPDEIRICWVPVLKGGADILSDPFIGPSGRRVPFFAAKNGALRGRPSGGLQEIDRSLTESIPSCAHARGGLLFSCGSDHHIARLTLAFDHCGDFGESHDLGWDKRWLGGLHARLPEISSHRKRTAS